MPEKVIAFDYLTTTEEVVQVDSIIIDKQITNKKHKVKLYTNSQQTVLFFTAGTDKQTWYHFYLFDVEGKLVRQLRVKGLQTTLIRNIATGNYTFEIFNSDVRIEAGRLSVI